MTSPIKIAIAGIGGVGGYFGGLLAAYYSGNESVEINFIARGEQANVMREKGLLLQTTHGEFLARPKAVTANASEIGVVDYFICCSKSYDLEKMVRDSLACIGTETIVLPLLNGVDANEKLEKLLPRNPVWQGCVYLVSRRIAPGIVNESGNIRKLYFGSDNGNKERLRQLENIFREAGVDATWSEEITETIWEKFLFISPIATLTSFLDKTIGAVFADEESTRLLNLLVSEIKSVADAKGILLPAETTQKNIDKMKSLPYEATSSMHSDFRKGGPTELESLTGFVIRNARSKNVTLPVYEMMYDSLRKKSSPTFSSLL